MWAPGDVEDLLAAIVELIDHTNRLLHTVWFKPPHPKPIWVGRPGAPAPTAPTGPRRVPLAAFLAAVNHGRSK